MSSTTHSSACFVYLLMECLLGVKLLKSLCVAREVNRSGKSLRMQQFEIVEPQFATRDLLLHQIPRSTDLKVSLSGILLTY